MLAIVTQATFIHYRSIFRSAVACIKPPAAHVQNRATKLRCIVLKGHCIEGGRRRRGGGIGVVPGVLGGLENNTQLGRLYLDDAPKKVVK